MLSILGNLNLFAIKMFSHRSWWIDLFIISTSVDKKVLIVKKPNIIENSKNPGKYSRDFCEFTVPWPVVYFELISMLT